MYKYKSKNQSVKLNSALKNTDTHLQIGTKTYHISCAISGIEGTCCLPSVCSQMSLHRCRTRRMSWILGEHHIKIVMVTDVLPMTRKDLAGSSFQHQ